MHYSNPANTAWLRFNHPWEKQSCPSAMTFLSLRSRGNKVSVGSVVQGSPSEASRQRCLSKRQGCGWGDSSQILISESRVYRREGARMCSEQHRHHSQGLTSHGVSLQLLTGCVSCGYEERGYWGWGEVCSFTLLKIAARESTPPPQPSWDPRKTPYLGACAAQFSVSLTQAGVICKEGTSTEKMTLPDWPAGKSMRCFPD